MTNLTLLLSYINRKNLPKLHIFLFSHLHEASLTARKFPDKIFLPDKTKHNDALRRL